MIRRIGWRRNVCRRIGQELELMEQVFGGMRLRPPIAKFDWKI
jgi:hypothetical protein